MRHDEDEIIHMFGQATRVRPRQSVLLRVLVHFHGKKRVLTQPDGLVRSNRKVSIHEGCVPEASERATWRSGYW